MVFTVIITTSIDQPMKLLFEKDMFESELYREIEEISKVGVYETRVDEKVFRASPSSVACLTYLSKKITRYDVSPTSCTPKTKNG
jgi:hypothetical protein